MVEIALQAAYQLFGKGQLQRHPGLGLVRREADRPAGTDRQQMLAEADAGEVREPKGPHGEQGEHQPVAIAIGAPAQAAANRRLGIGLNRAGFAGGSSP